MDFPSSIAKCGHLKGNIFLNTEFVGNFSSMEHSQGSFKKPTLLNGNFVLAGWIACNNRLQAIIFTISAMLYFGVTAEHDSFLKQNNKCISREKNNHRFSEC